MIVDIRNDQQIQ